MNDAAGQVGLVLLITGSGVPLERCFSQRESLIL